MLEEIIAFLQSINPIYIYLTVFGIAYIENIFPPFPSDVIVAFSGALAAISSVSVPIVITFAICGSTLGFLTMYFVGKTIGDKILEKGKIKFISPQSVFRVEQWFRKYGIWLIVGNRFLAGTRAVISFFAGMSEMNLKLTLILSTISALIWNLILIYVGYFVGHNLSRIQEWLSTYNKIVLILIVTIFVLLLTRYFINKRKNDKD